MDEEPRTTPFDAVMRAVLRPANKTRLARCAAASIEMDELDGDCLDLQLNRLVDQVEALLTLLDTTQAQRR